MAAATIAAPCVTFAACGFDDDVPFVALSQNDYGDPTKSLMSNQPLVSIGLPTYNRAPSLARAIESVQTQSYSHLELVISDNASTDNTQAICIETSQRDPRLKYLRQQSNQGAIGNTREVLRSATGEFFMWLADDDWIDRSYVARCVELLTSNPEYLLVCGKARYYCDQEFLFEEPGLDLLNDSNTERVLAYYDRVGWNGAVYGLMRREELVAINLENVLGADWCLMAAIALKGKIKTLENTFIHRSASGASGDVREYALGFGLKGFSARNPHLSIASRSFKTIGWKSSVYDQLKWHTRLWLGCRVFVKICRRFVLERWYAQAIDRMSESHPRLSRTAKLIKSKLRTTFRTARHRQV